jgi:hypothetical protein
LLLLRLTSNVKVDENGCWIWQLSLNEKGYPRIGVAGRTTYAHIVSYELFNGSIEAGNDVDHTCEVKACINPEHLEQVTHKENTDRRDLSLYKGLCKKGLHEMTGYNNMRMGKRHTCRKCYNEQKRAYRRSH